MKKYITIALWTLAILGTLILSGFINSNLREEQCKQVLIDIDDKAFLGFMTEGDVMDLLNREFNTPISQKIKDIDTYLIESMLDGHHAIEKSQVYLSIDGKLHIKIRQRKPLVRVFGNEISFYIDEQGEMMPISPKYTARVMVASGNIPVHAAKIRAGSPLEEDEKKVYDDIYKLASFLSKKPFWKAQIEQLYVNKDSEFELIPRVGNHTIVLGEVNNLEKKFEKLALFYNEGLSKTGWNEYRTINLKFKNQVVCTKRY